MIIAPSILSADFANLQRDVEMLNSSHADWLHVDVMDGVFVPNISLGIPIVKAIKKHATKLLDVHLMIVNPEKYIKDFFEAGAEYISVHYESCIHLHRTVHAIKELGIKAGVAVNPHTSVGLLNDIIADVDLVCMMSVNPGFGGQKFIENTYSKIAELKEIILQKKSSALIEIDGGVDLNNASKLKECGTDILVCGNSVFSSPSPVQTINQLKHI